MQLPVLKTFPQNSLLQTPRWRLQTHRLSNPGRTGPHPGSTSRGQPNSLMPPFAARPPSRHKTGRHRTAAINPGNPDRARQPKPVRVSKNAHPDPRKSKPMANPRRQSKSPRPGSSLSNSSNSSKRPSRVRQASVPPETRAVAAAGKLPSLPIRPQHLLSPA